jgi:hypothetical protein
MVKNPRTKVVINNDTTQYDLAKLRREHRQKERLIHKELSEIRIELSEIKILILKLVEGANG